MMEPKEFSRTVTISVSAILFIVGLTFWITKFYLTQSTLERRVEKKYERLDERIKILEESIQQCP